MPTRVVRDWTDSLRFESLSPEAERLFIRLIMKADDFGRYHADPRLVKAGCFPLIAVTHAEIMDCLGALSAVGLVVVYTSGGRSYISIPNFRQRGRSGASKFPAPDGEVAGWMPTVDRQLTVTCPTVDGHMTGICQASALGGGGGDGGGGEGGGEGGGVDGAIAQGAPPGLGALSVLGGAVDPPPGWPRSERGAVAVGEVAGVPGEFSGRKWNEAAGVGFVDWNGKAIRSFGHWIKSEWGRNQDHEKRSANRAGGHRGDHRPNRNLGTANPGDAAPYVASGNVVRL